MGSLIIVLTAVAIYCSEVNCDTRPTKAAKLEDTVLLEKNNSRTTIEKGSFWKTLGSSNKHKPTKVEPRILDGTSGTTDKRKARFMNSLAFLTGLGFGGLATAASSTMKSMAKIPQVLSINLGSSKTSPYFAAYYSQYPYASLLPSPLFYPGILGLAPMIDTAKPQTSQNGDLSPQVINLFDNRPSDLAGNNEDYADTEISSISNGADDRIRLRAEADRNAEEKKTIRGCKEEQRKHGSVKGTAREREYIYMNIADSDETLNFQANTTQKPDNTTIPIKPTKPTRPTIRPTNTTGPPDSTNTTHHHHHHHHHHHGQNEFHGYYGGYPQDIHHVDLTTIQPYSQISYNAPYEQPANFYQDNKYHYAGFNPSYSAPFPSDQTNEYAGTDFNQVHPSGFQPPNISDGFKPLK